MLHLASEGQKLMFADCKYAKIKNWCIENEYESIFLNNYPSKVAWLTNIQYMKKSFQMEKKRSTGGLWEVEKVDERV